MKRKSFFLVFLVMLPIFSWAVTNIRGQAVTKVYVDPSLVTANPGETFTVNIKIADVDHLWDYEFRLEWNSTLLDVTKVTEGPFLSAEDTYETFFVKKEDFPSPGHLYVACTLYGEPVTAVASGEGTLVTVEFQVLDVGGCILDLYDTKLEDYDRHLLTHTAEDGLFEYHLSEIGVDPPSIIDPSLIRGSTFNVSVRITKTIEVYGWGFNMSWNPNVLNVTEIKEGPFLSQKGAYNTLFATEISQEEGYFHANCTLSGEPPEASASGNGTLVIVTFMVKNSGATVLHISGTTLMDYERIETPTLTKDGYFSCISRDVAIISVSVSPNMVRTGDSVSISVVAKNEGDVTFGRSVDVTIYYNESFLGTIGVPDVSPGDQRTVSFSWSTQGLAEGDYILEAVASQLHGETNTANNRYVYEYLTLMPPEQSFSFMPIIAVLVIVILVAFASFILLKKRR